MSDLGLLGLGAVLGSTPGEVHLARVVVRQFDITKPHQLAVSLDSRENEVILPSLCLAPVGATVWMIGKGKDALVLGPAQWISYVPTITQLGNVTYNGLCRILVEGYKCTYSFDIAITGAGTAANLVLLSLPFAPVFGSSVHMGSFDIYDASTVTRYNQQGELNGVNPLMLATGDVSANGGWGTNPNLALAAGDAIRGTIVYEIA